MLSLMRLRFLRASNRVLLASWFLITLQHMVFTLALASPPCMYLQHLKGPSLFRNTDQKANPEIYRPWFSLVMFSALNSTRCTLLGKQMQVSKGKTKVLSPMPDLTIFPFLITSTHSLGLPQTHIFLRQQAIRVMRGITTKEKIERFLLPNSSREPIKEKTANLFVNLLIPGKICYQYYGHPSQIRSIIMIEIQDQIQRVADEARKHPSFEFKLDLKTKPEASLAFVAFHGPSSIFLEAALKPEAQIGTLNFSRAKQQSLANIYFQDARLYIVFKLDFDSCVEYFLGQFIFDNFKFQRLIVIDWKQEALLENKGQQLRHLKTRNWNDKCFGHVFKGFVNGTTTSLLVEGEIRGVPTIQYIGIVGDYQVSRKDIELYKALEGYDLKMGDSSAVIKKYNQYRSNSRLYI